MQTSCIYVAPVPGIGLHANPIQTQSNSNISTSPIPRPSPTSQMSRAIIIAIELNRGLLLGIEEKTLHFYQAVAVECKFMLIYTDQKHIVRE